MDTVDAFQTPGITSPAAFDGLRRQLHDAAGTDRIAASRTRDIIAQLRTHAAFLSERMEMYRGVGLGYWYAEMATRLSQTAEEIEADARANGIIGGAA